MKAIILAAGRGSRMQNLTDEAPKCLLEVRGKALIDWQIEALNRAGIDEIALVTGYRAESLRSRGMVEFHNSEWSSSNMVKSLSLANDWLMAGPCIVTYSDIIFGPSAVSSLIQITSPFAVAYDPDWIGLWQERFEDPLDDAESFRLNADATLAEIGGKATSIESIEGQYMGILRYSPEAWDEVARIRRSIGEDEFKRLSMTALLQLVIGAGRVPVTAVPHLGNWAEFDTAKDWSLYRGLVV